LQYDDAAYLTADIEILGSTYGLDDMRPVSLCGDAVVPQSTNRYDCPGDGTYGFTVDYPLPNIGTTWLASGWVGTGTFRMYASYQENVMIGQCTFTMNTYRTTSSESSSSASRGFRSLQRAIPSAAATAGVLLGTAAAFALVCAYCTCRTKSAREEKDEFLAALTSDEISTIFKQLDENTRSAYITMAATATSSGRALMATATTSVASSCGCSSTQGIHSDISLMSSYDNSPPSSTSAFVAATYESWSPTFPSGCNIPEESEQYATENEKAMQTSQPILQEIESAATSPAVEVTITQHEADADASYDEPVEEKKKNRRWGTTGSKRSSKSGRKLIGSMAI